MKNRILLISAVLCMAMLLPSCGKKADNTAETADVWEPIEAAEETEQAEAVPADDSAEVAPAEPAAEAEAAAEAAADATADTASEEQAAAPVEYETADGFMSSFLLASERDKIDTTDEYGTFYRVIYEASIEGDELIACGSMDYRNSMEQDSMYITSDLKHIFKVDANTVYQKGGEESTDTVSREEFAELLTVRKDSGMFLGIETKNGVVTTAMLFAQ